MQGSVALLYIPLKCTVFSTELGCVADRKVLGKGRDRNLSGYLPGNCFEGFGGG